MNLMKEKSWNNRFIYSKIPNYDATKDKNVLYFIVKKPKGLL